MNRDAIINGLIFSLMFFILFLWGVRIVRGQVGALAVDTSKTTVVTAKIEKAPIKFTGELSVAKPFPILAGAKTLIRVVVITDEPIMTVDAEGKEVPSGAVYERIFDCEKVSILKGITTLTPVSGKVVTYPTDKIRFYVIDRGGAK